MMFFSAGFLLFNSPHCGNRVVAFASRTGKRYRSDPGCGLVLLVSMSKYMSIDLNLSFSYIKVDVSRT